MAVAGAMVVGRKEVGGNECVGRDDVATRTSNRYNRWTMVSVFRGGG